MRDPSNDATVLPYFEGDYWVSAAEAIIKDIKAGKKIVIKTMEDEESEEDDDYSDDDEEGIYIRKKNKKRGYMQPNPNCIYRGEKDAVMIKLASLVEPMKDAFIVARLRPREFAMHYEQQRRAELQGSFERPMKMARDGGGGGRFMSYEEEMMGMPLPKPASASSSSSASSVSWGSGYGKKKSANVAAGLNAKGFPVCFNQLRDDTEDVDDTIDFEFFESRQSFLALCQNSHYQFDQLRRAKHTSMMVLYHLHNPDTPHYVATSS